VLRGDALLGAMRESGTTLGGIVRRLAQLGHAVLPALSATAPPSGLIEHDFYESLCTELIAVVRRERPDAIALGPRLGSIPSMRSRIPGSTLSNSAGSFFSVADRSPLKPAAAPRETLPPFRSSMDAHVHGFLDCSLNVLMLP
jgi:hypothetical protein